MSLLEKRKKTILPNQVSDSTMADKLSLNTLTNNMEISDITKVTLNIPVTNIIENEKKIEIKLAAPGLDRKHFTVEVNNNILIISSTKEIEKTGETENYLRKEYSYNSFCRSFTLPENSMPDKIFAKYENGILLISVPKKIII